jgi:hypothetical protein
MRPISHPPLYTVKSGRSLSIPVPRPVGRIVSAIQSFCLGAGQAPGEGAGELCAKLKFAAKVVALPPKLFACGKRII